MYAVAAPVGRRSASGDRFVEHGLERHPNRAGVVGQAGLGPLVTRLYTAQPALRIHLLGHSFGARVVSFALAGLPDDTGVAEPSPIKSLGLIQAAYITRLTRSAMLEALGQDWVRTAYAKGLSDRVVHYKHVLRNIMIPVVTAMGLYTGTILGGAVLTETVFNRPGLGKLLVGAIAQRDYTLIQSGLMVFAFIILVVNLLVDLSYALFDPRVKYE